MDKKVFSFLDLEKFYLNQNDIQFLVNEGITVGNFGHIYIDKKFDFIENGVVLAYDSGIKIYCSNQNNGVFACEPKYNRYVNSSTEAFHKTLLRYSKYCSDVKDATTEEYAVSIVDSAIEDFKKIDNKAWSKDENYWPIVAQQMLEGNL